jgi:hypothetical protein
MLVKSIDKLFEKDQPIDQEEAKAFADSLLRNFEASERKFYRRILTILAIWLITIGIHVGIFEEATVASFKLKNLENLIILSPLFIGSLVYGTVTAFCGASTYLFATRRIYKHLWPSIFREELLDLAMPPTFWSIEVIFAKRQKKFLKSLTYGWWLVVTLGVFGLILLAQVYTSYIAIQSPTYSLWISVCVVAVSSLITLKAVPVFIATVEYSN